MISAVIFTPYFSQVIWDNMSTFIVKKYRVDLFGRQPVPINQQFDFGMFKIRFAVDFCGQCLFSDPDVISNLLLCVPVRRVYCTE